jgi:hypothetical protein
MTGHGRRGVLRGYDRLGLNVRGNSIATFRQCQARASITSTKSHTVEGINGGLSRRLIFKNGLRQIHCRPKQNSSERH